MKAKPKPADSVVVIQTRKNIERYCDVLVEALDAANRRFSPEYQEEAAALIFKQFFRDQNHARQCQAYREATQRRLV